MKINADFSAQAAVRPDPELWVHSPEAGVDRLMLDRIGEEVARATSLVRYAAGSEFSRHEHAMGEEFLVLDGVFSDETGHYPAGSYVRNPPGSSHAPFSKDGCRIFVKLRQFDAADLEQFSVDTRDTGNWTDAVCPLHRFGTETVVVRRLEKGACLTIHAGGGGAELLVIEGSLVQGDDAYGPEAWLRFPPGEGESLVANDDSLVWIKTGHLSELARTGD